VRLRICRLAAIPLALAVGTLAGCTGSGSTGPSSVSSTVPSESPLPTVDIGNVAFAPGKFAYSYLGVGATLAWSGGDGTLRVHNGSGSELGAPGLDAVTADRPRVPGTVTDAAPIPVGASATFSVTFPAGLSPDDVGMIALLFGDENWGAFAPVPKGTASAAP
jgi:hypothetical protein